MNSKVRKVKRYSNRKLYDTTISSYVNLDGLAVYLQNGEDVVVVENDSEKDITAETLTQLILQHQKRHESSISIDLLKSLIMQLPKVETSQKLKKVKAETESPLEVQIDTGESVVVGGSFWSE